MEICNFKDVVLSKQFYYFITVYFKISLGEERVLSQISQVSSKISNIYHIFLIQYILFPFDIMPEIFF